MNLSCRRFTDSFADIQDLSAHWIHLSPLHFSGTQVRKVDILVNDMHAEMNGLELSKAVKERPRKRSYFLTQLCRIWNAKYLGFITWNHQYLLSFRFEDIESALLSCHSLDQPGKQAQTDIHPGKLPSSSPLLTDRSPGLLRTYLGIIQKNSCLVNTILFSCSIPPICFLPGSLIRPLCPDQAVFKWNGTWLSCPVTLSAVLCFMQAFPNL